MAVTASAFAFMTVRLFLKEAVAQVAQVSGRYEASQHQAPTLNIKIGWTS